MLSQGELGDKDLSAHQYKVIVIIFISIVIIITIVINAPNSVAAPSAGITLIFVIITIIVFLTIIIIMTSQAQPRINDRLFLLEHDLPPSS